MSRQRRTRKNRQLSSLSEAERSKLQQLISGAEASETTQITESVTQGELIPLTPAQKILWYAWKLDPKDTAYNLGGTLHFKGVLNAALVERAFDDLCQTHDALRIKFFEDDAQDVWQLDASHSTFTLYEAEAECLTSRDEKLKAVVSKPFDLLIGQLLRVGLVTLNGDSSLVVTLHHIIADGTSMQQLLDEFVAIYVSLDAGHAVQVVEKQVGYLDFAKWLNKQDKTALYDSQLTVWRELLNGDDEPLGLPANNQARQQVQYKVSTATQLMAEDTWQQITLLANERNVTPYLIILTAWQLLLSRFANTDRVNVGVPVANRHMSETLNLIGFFVNTQVIPLSISNTDSFSQLLSQASQTSRTALGNQDLPFELLLKALNPERQTGVHPIFQVMFNYLRRDKSSLKQLGKVALDDYEFYRFGIPFDLQLDVIEDKAEGTILNLIYANELYNKEFATQCLTTLDVLLKRVLRDIDSPLVNLPLLANAEVSQLHDLSQGAQPHSFTNPIHEVISAQSAKTPDAIAVRFADTLLSYAQLETKTNQLAHYLMSQGVQAEDKVGVVFERSLEMVISLLGVIKAGAAYVPIDPNLPIDRVEYIAQSSGLALLLCDDSIQQLASLKEVASVCYFADIPLSTYADKATNIPIEPTQLAYAIYTSGSTGKPKGVGNTHEAIYNRIAWQQSAYSLTEADVVLQKTPFGFDVSVWEFFWPLMYGAQLVVAPPNAHKDSTQLLDIINENNITTLHFVPSMLQAFIGHEDVNSATSIKHILCSGEALPSEVQATALEKLPNASVYNLYGPTEAAVDVSHFTCHGNASLPVPIGEPIAGIQLYVLDHSLNLSPHRVAGELYIGGIGLARGYVNRPDLTAERFIANPFANDGSRLYRTGDLVCWNANGQLEYLGRTDHQVKIRGFRIELGEIEASLYGMSAVREAVVIADQGPSGQRLVAYVSGHNNADVDSKELQQALGERLPDYMVPSVIIVLDTLPLNSNGKVDRKALPEPVAQVQTSYQAPQGLREELLGQTWQRVLGHTQISRDDNFFALGGDSILSLQIVAAMRQHGYALSAKQLFDAPTIAQLASQLRDLKDDDMAAQIVSGDVPLLPIQHTYFARQPAKLSHWNQAIRLTPPKPIGLTELAQSVQALIKHHDSLRLQYTQQGVWHQAYRAYDEVDYREALWYQKTTDSEFNRYLSQAAEQAQASLNITRGDNIRVVYVHSETRQQLILIAHHLVIDGVSWRILIDDLVQGIEQTVSGSIITLTPKSHSYQYWAQQLQAYPSTYADEFALWDSQQSTALALPNFVAGGDDTMQSAKTLQSELSEAQTHALLSQAQRPYRTQIDELLLTALSVALEKWTGANDAQVFIEGHGREPWQSGLDLSRTLGWFTALYPIKLTRFMDIADTIIATKERLRALPNKGIGYGAFKYYGSEAQQQALKTQCKPQIEFNYLGQLDASSNAQFADWQMSTDGVGSSIAAENPLSADIAINCAVQNGQLQLSITYSSACLLQADMAEFAHLFEQAIGDVIDHCTDAQIRFTPADVPLLTMSQVELDELPIPQPLVSSIYPLTAMQQGMMFHSMAEQSAAYLNQLRLDITGLDVARFKAAWQLVVERHDALRSGFISASKEPLQYVVKDHQITFTELNWQSSSDQTTDTLAKALLDKGFVVTEQVGLMSFTLVQLAAAEHHFIWTYHHMLLDGWSSTAVLAEVMMAYQEQALAVPGGQFKDYLSYLANQNIAASDKYWQGRLEQLRDATYLTELQSSVNEPSEHGYAKYTLQLNEQQAEQLQTFAQQQQITVNTVLQGAWSLLLGRMLNKSVVCFGATTSGRPADLVGSDHTVGLFINTLPVISTLDNEKTVGQWLKERQQDSMASREFEHTPLNQIQKLAEGLVSFNQQGLFDSLLIFENYPVSDTLGAADFNGTRFNLVENREETNYPLTVFVETAQGLTINFAYQGWRLSEERVTQLASNLERLLDALQTHVEKPLSQIQLLDDNAQGAIAKLGRGQSEVLSEKDALALFEERAEQTPKAVAVRNEYSEYITYAALNQRANQLAHALIARGVTTETPIVVSMTRGIEMILAILAVNKAGGVYVPIALELPDERRDYIFKHSGAKLVLTNTNSHFADDITSLNITEMVLDSYSDTKPNNVRHHDQLVYTLYTSGSTGLPKGVAINHGNLLNFLLGMQKRLGLESTLNALALTSLSFDISGLEIYLPLISGGTVTVANDTTALTPALLSEQDLLQATPAGWRSLLALNLLSDVDGTLALCGGEALPAELVGELAKTGVALWNMYGPTETTIWSSCYHVEQPAVHLGDAILNTQLYVLDNQLNLCPQMVVGELYIAGAGLARGYLSRPDLSAERFVANPFADDGSRLYRSGDLVRWNDQDQLEYLGRTDHQVKIRGYRIELGDIEAQLYRCDGVKEAVVIDDNSTGSTQLVGYVSGEQLDAEIVKVSISQWLPDYMMPALITVLDDIPHNSNGKIDRNALPKPQWQAPQAFEAAQTEIECHLAAIWQTVLGAEQVGRHDSFFALGGDSISSLRVIALAKKHNLFVPVDALFESADLAQLAARLEAMPMEVLDIPRLAIPYTGLSYAQQRQWLLWKLDPSSAAYHITGALRLTGDLDLTAVEQALTYVMQRHDSLRTHFSETAQGDVLQQISVSTDLPLVQHDVSAGHSASRDALFTEVFDLLGNEPLVRFGLFKYSENSYELGVVLHHIIADGWSVKLLIDDFVAAYEAIKQGDVLQVGSPELRYSDYAKWQQVRLNDGEEVRQLAYWQDKLGSDHSVLGLPYDKTFSTEDKRSANHEWTLPSELKGQLNQVAKQQGCTLFSILMAAWQVVLHRFSGESHIKVGMPTANRQYSGCENVVGMFVNTQVIANKLDGAQSLLEVVNEVAQTLTEAQANQDLPFEKLVDALDVPRDSHSTPIFQVMMNHQQISEDKLAQLSGLEFEVMQAPRIEAQLDLTLNSFEDAFGTLNVSIEYFAARFSAARVKTLGDAFSYVLSMCAERPDMLVSELELLTSDTQKQLISKGCGKTCSFKQSVLLQFAEAVHKNTDAVVLRHGHIDMHYGELDARSNQLANYLIAQGVQAEDNVGLVFSRGIDMIVSMLAVLKAGAVYVPLAPSLPAERVAYICEHSELVYALCNTEHSLPEHVHIWSLNDDGLTKHSTTAPDINISSEQLAYVLYTSGSTGKPKGVAISHGSLSNFVASMAETFDSNDSHAWLALTSLSFDISGLEIYLPLLHGSTLVIADSVMDVDSDLLSQVTHVQATPAGWRSLLAQEVLGQPLVGLCGGEALPESLAQALKAQQVQLFNMYGPTETTIWSSCHEVGASIHLGDAIHNTQLYVLDSALNLCPPLVQGELYIAGDGLARGYLARPDLTAERFIANPFDEVGSRLYRTGDNVRWNGKGELEYLGRVDHQVKVRGFRIELGEIEAVLDSQAGVRAAVVVADEGPNGARLVAYVESDTVEQAELNALLASKLPEYMLPNVIVILAALPLNTSGKVDRKALPKAEAQMHEFMAPETELESKLADIWQTVLGAEQVGRHDNFFALGGDSITSLRFIAAAKQAEVYLDIADVFKAHDLQALALLASTKKPEKLQPLERLEPAYSGLSYAQQRQWFLWKLAPDSDAYHISGGLMLRGQLDMHALQSALDHVVAKHSTLRTRFHDDSKGSVTQYVQAHTACHIATLPASASVSEQQMLRSALVSKPFDLANDLLYRIAVIAHDDEQHELIVVMHHIISDGWSMNLIINDFVIGYKAAKQQQALTIDAQAARYSDYAKWQKSWLENGAEQRQLTYWHSVLGDEHPVLELPTDLHTTEQEYLSAELRFDIAPVLQEQLAQVAKRHETTLFSVLMAAWHVLLQRVSGQSEVRVGMPIANRQHADTQDMVGFFVNTQIIKTHMTGAETVDDVMALIVTALQGAQANQDLPFEKLVNSFELDRSMGDNALFQVMMNHQRQEEDNLATLPGLDIVETQLPNTSAQFALVLNVLEAPNKPVNIGFEYAVERFSAQRMKELVDGYQAILATFADNACARVANITVLPANTTADILALGQEQVSHWSTALTQQIIAEQAALDGHKAALVCNEDTLSYATLTHRVAQFAQYLKAAGVNHEAPVGIACSRSIDMVIALLGAWQAGACVIPMEPDLPAERFMQINAQSELALLISDGHFVHTITVPMLDITACDYQQLAGSDTPLVIHPQQTAYVIYTSGSTGVPKGVAVSHEALTHHCQAMQHNYQLTSQDSCVLFASLSFDAGLEQLLVPLMAGSKVVIVDAKQTTANDFNALCHKQNITAVDLPSVYLKQLAPLPNVRLCIVGGEAWSRHDFEYAQQQLPNASLVNAYGPTEAVITPTLWRGDACTHVNSAYVPIGRAVGQRRLYILDAQLNLLTTGMTGELYIGGPALARGYVGRADFTAERFIANPFVDTGERLYRTGDLARWNERGELEYVGRIDHQVKIRGFRVELGEVEAALNAQAGIDSSLVMVDNNAEHARLVAYVVGKLVDEAQLRQAIAEQLPQYMVPQAIMVLTCWPTTVNGKIDRKALPDVTFASDRHYEAPVGEVENKLAMIWSEVLDSSDIGRLDNFFLLGGDSISALRVVSRIEQTLSVNCPVKLMFEAPILAQLATKVAALEATTKPNLVPIERVALHGLSPAQLSLWLSDQLTDNPLDKQAYNISGGVSLVGDVCVETLQSAFDATIARHETLRMQFIDNLGDASVEILPKVMFDLPLHDLSQLEPELAQQQAKELQIELEHAIFDLAKAPLIKACLVKLADVYHLYVNLHHIIADGWSIGVLVQDLGLAYQGLLEGTAPSWHALPIQYVDYAAWQQAQLTGPQGEETRQFWRQSLASAPANSALPPHFPRPEQMSSDGASVELNFDETQTAHIKAFAKSRNISLHTVLLSAYQLFLHAVTAKDDVIIGSDLAGRDHPDLELLIGFFIRVLPQRSIIDPNQTLADYLSTTQAHSLDMVEHQALGLEALIELSQVDRIQGVQPLVQQLFVMQNTPQETWPVAGLSLEPLESKGAINSKFDSALFVMDENELQCSWVFRKQLYNVNIMQQLLGRWQQCVMQLITESEKTIRDLLSPMTQDIKTMQKATQGKKFSGLKKGLKKRSVKKAPAIKTRFLPDTESFPVIIEPSTADLDPIAWAEQNRTVIDQHLNQSAGIIFRNFALATPQDFEKFADAIQPGLYGQYGDLPKKEGGKKTYKSTPYPEKQMILYHNESAHLSKWPRKQWFFCELPSVVGGATPIVDCRRMLQVLPADIVEKFSTKGLLYVRNFIKNLDVSWQDFYKTDSKQEVESLLHASNTEFKWLDNDGLQTRTKTHGVIAHPITGARSFFNQVQLHHESCLAPDVRSDLIAMVGQDLLPRNVFYGDGSAISYEEMAIIGDAYEHCAVRFDWQKGDVVMVDNMLAAHARDPYEEPRKIVVAMGDMVNQADLASTKVCESGETV
ncbi:hypothetical protein PCIT_a3671 [Pseudoalteromonas citrea]|uniref:Carrier domain-containing protein n=2 Tax=Pseudoalteromonas citrea TaxID=43655 RepID=A0AAD4AGA4_9GAMM|nr:non-ribosomal peptide synthetase [Pseudoalteromonas citrea]KAF7767618.1 hypothetical protein PCIT_a3671 [Pseudoalteromonas citrea]